VSAIVLVGPSRQSSETRPSYWDRARFSSDRRMARLVSSEVIESNLEQQDIRRRASSMHGLSGIPPTLLMDGEREGERQIRVLAEAAAEMGPSTRHVTVVGSHHYCGAYQLPWPSRTVFVRLETFDRCSAALSEFLRDHSSARR
jgi:hypothetical protein